MEIKISHKVKQSIDEIYKYSYKLSPNYALKIVNKIYNTIYNLQYAPYIGRYVPELSSRCYRERICGNYRIIYFVSEKYNTIFIRYIICSRQDSNLFFEVHKNQLSRFLNQFFK